MSESTSLETIFFAALEKASGQRAAYLDEACAGDDSLRRRVERMLAAQANSGSFLETPPAAVDATAGPTIDQPPAERPGTRIGPYKLLQQIGEGGMGVVYLAEQTQPVQRRVALKLIKAGMDSGQVIARFEAERQALAIMDHPNIARVLDAGTTESGRPYFVMELVNGIPVTQFCDEQHLTTRERLELFVPICQAVQHAHQKGIIHRDIKPTNILVALYDGRPVPKVIDFGVAKAISGRLTEKTMFTGLGQMVGTLEYMSPEQAQRNQLDIDTRSDVYSLGVVLYELLTGDTPFDKRRLQSAALDELLRIIREEEPPKPSTKLSSSETLPSVAANRKIEPANLSALVRGELDWIVMKALEKDRNRRYETATSFADDVLRYLNEEPVQACPPSTWYQLQKIAQRNRVALAISALVLFFLVLLGSGIGWAVRDRAAREAAIGLEVNLALKEAAQWQEQANWPEALSAAKRAEGLLAGGGSDELRASVHQLRKDIEMVLRLEEIRLLSSEIKDNGLSYEKADREYARAFADYGIDVASLPTEEAAARIRARAGVSLSLAAALDYWAFSRKDQAGSLPLMALAQAADPDPWRRQVRAAAQQRNTKPRDTKPLAALAASPELLRQPPTTLVLVAGTLHEVGLAQAQIDLLREAQRQYPGDFWINVDLAGALARMEPPERDEAISFFRAALAVRPQSVVVYYNLGGALYEQGKLDEASACFRKAVELDPKFSFADNNLGSVLLKQGKVEEAIACFRKAIELDPKSASYHANLGQALGKQGKLDEAIAACRKAVELEPKLAVAHNNLGVALEQQGKSEEAMACLRQAIALDPKYAAARTHLGNVLDQQGKVDEAIAAHQKAIELDPKLAMAHSNLGSALLQQGKVDEAIACCLKAIELDPQLALAHMNLGNALKEQGKLDEAVACHCKAIELDPKLAGAHTNLGNALERQGKVDEAIACHRLAIELDPKLAGAHTNLGWALFEQGKVEEAFACYRKAIELDPNHAKAYTRHGIALERQGKPDEAIASHKKAIELDPKLAAAHTNLGAALHARGQVDEAIACFRKVIELDPKLATAHSNLGTALYGQGKLDEAIACHRKAIELDPKLTLASNDLGNALYRQGKLDEAIAAYRQAIALDPKLASAHNGLGTALSDQKQLDEAIVCYRKAIELDPKWAAGHSNLGDALREQGKLDESIAALRKAIELDPTFALAHMNLGLALCGQGKLDEGIACFRQAIELDPKYASAHNNLGTALHGQGKLDEAIACYRKAIEFDPKLALAYTNLGNNLARQGKLDEAIAAHQKAIELEPQSAGARNGLAWLLVTCADPKFRDPRRAVELAVKAVELDPHHPSYPNTLGVAQYRAGNWKAAIVALEKSRELRQGGDSNDWFFLAMAHWQLGEKEKARQWFDRAVQWMDTNRPKDDDLKRFRSEATELLGAKEK